VVNKPVYQIGIDAGSTTVKAVVVDSSNDIVWKKYSRHNTKQASLVLDYLLEIKKTFPDTEFRIFITGSGGRSVAHLINAQYIQEVNAVTYAVERLCPDTRSVVELGGQDAKVIIWKEDEQGRTSTLTFMNDKCAGGTGATIDKIINKIGISFEEAESISLQDQNIHHIAAKCGVFAETDVVGLLKSGIDQKEIVISLLSAIVKQNLEVLVRGNVLSDKVLLLGGPHTYFNVLADLWRKYLPETWKIHGWKPADKPLDELIYVPDDSQYFAAIGAVFFGMESDELLSSFHDGISNEKKLYNGIDKLEHFISEGRLTQLMSSGAVKNGLAESEALIEEFSQEYSIPDFIPPEIASEAVHGCIGIDGGSTSSKLVLIDQEKKLLYKDYILSKGNPIEDVRLMFMNLKSWAEKKNITLHIKKTAVTGYAMSILKEAFCFDLGVVETVAHMRSAVHYYGNVDVICDVGGQDIKVMFMKHGRVVDFKLNTQCSAGNGFFLQGMAEQFGIPIEEYAAHAFKAVKAPAFNYGCAVFMEQDRVNFQQLGWTKEEIMAGLALVLPLNIWNYVVQETNIARLGKSFILQGGTQKNLAAVKSQVDYIQSKVPDAQIYVHKYADVSGAIGAAIEASMSPAAGSDFIGLEDASHITFSSRNDETTRCTFCTNKCTRTFIEIQSGKDRSALFISGYACEKGMATNAADMKQQQKEKREKMLSCSNLVKESAEYVFSDFDYNPLPKDGTLWTDPYISDSPKKRFARSSDSALKKRRDMVVGIPRLLNMFKYSPFFSTYLRALGVGSIIYSDYTSQELWAEGNIWGAIDPCFPAKVAPAHIYNLIKRKKPTHICFPIITHLESQVENTLGNNACVIQMGTPEVVYAVFTRGRDYFKDHSIEFWKPLTRLDRPLEAAGELFSYFKDILGITRDESDWACHQAYTAQAEYLSVLREKGTAVINKCIEDDKLALLVIGHPYHHDPGLNHGLLDEFQVLGYPILCIESLPVSSDFLEPLFDGDNEDKVFNKNIKDVWQRNFNRNTNLKFWAAKVAARHPNLAVIDFSSFKCGHDAPTYSYIDNILDASATPHFLFHDVDQNKPRASQAIRIQTIDYFLKLEEKRLHVTVKNLEKAG
jgi:predicted CoA-substrate-specific enzyme activase